MQSFEKLHGNAKVLSGGRRKNRPFLTQHAPLVGCNASASRDGTLMPHAEEVMAKYSSS